MIKVFCTEILEDENFTSDLQYHAYIHICIIFFKNMFLQTTISLKVSSTSLKLLFKLLKEEQHYHNYVMLALAFKVSFMICLKPQDLMFFSHTVKHWLKP